jgi:hypothetical protein
MLRTAAMREAAERRQAEAFGPVPVRVHFPDGLIVQAAFSALDPLSMLQVEWGRRQGGRGIGGSWTTRSCSALPPSPPL